MVPGVGTVAGAEGVGAAGGLLGGFVGSTLGAARDAVSALQILRANAGKARGGNAGPNGDAARIAREYNLNPAGQRALHDIITGQGYSLDEIREEAERLSKQDKYTTKPSKEEPPEQR